MHNADSETTLDLRVFDCGNVYAVSNNQHIFQYRITGRCCIKVWTGHLYELIPLTNLRHRSGSMKPGFDRGDLLLLSNPPYEQYKPGDIIVYRVHDSETPIVHRILETHDAATSSSDSTEDGHSIGWMLGYGQSAADQLMLTKGDNNRVDDIELYKGLEWLQRKHVIGKVRG